MVKERFTIGITEDAKLIREEVFIKEQGAVNEFDEKDSCLWELVLYLDGYPISTGRIEKLDPETYQIERVAVRKPFRGQKVGTYTVKYLMNKIISLGGRKAYIHAQIDKVGFYRKLGFRIIPDAKPFMEEGIEHIEMTRNLIKKPAKRR